MPTAYLGLGSNLAEPAVQVRQAINTIAQLEQSHISAVSSLYRSLPMGPTDQPDYINAVLALNTNLAPLQLLDALQAIELAAGRTRKGERWGARILDLDVLLYGDIIINTERLVVPHYGLQQRAFVLLPLAEIAPNLQLPDGSKLTQLIKNISTNGLTKLE